MSATPIPTGHELLAAFRGARGHLPGDNVLLRWAQDLAHLHRSRHINPRNAPTIDVRRCELVALINGCAYLAAHRSPDLAPLGFAVDELARRYVVFEVLFRATDDALDFEAMRTAWDEIGVQVVAWADLVSGERPVPRQDRAAALATHAER